MHFVVFEQSLHCLLKPVCMIAWGIYGDRLTICNVKMLTEWPV